MLLVTKELVEKIIFYTLNVINLLIQYDFICLFVYTEGKSCIFTQKTVVILICDFGAQKVKRNVGKPFFLIQDTQIRLIKVVSKHFYPKMPTGILFCGISTGLYDFKEPTLMYMFYLYKYIL